MGHTRLWAEPSTTSNLAPGFRCSPRRASDSSSSQSKQLPVRGTRRAQDQGALSSRSKHRFHAQARHCISFETRVKLSQLQVSEVQSSTVFNPFLVVWMWPLACHVSFISLQICDFEPNRHRARAPGAKTLNFHSLRHWACNHPARCLQNQSLHHQISTIHFIIHCIIGFPIIQQDALQNQSLHH